MFKEADGSMTDQEDETAAFSIPTCIASSHESRNPFKSGDLFVTEDSATLRIDFTPRIPIQLIIPTIPSREVQNLKCEELPYGQSMGIDVRKETSCTLNDQTSKAESIKTTLCPSDEKSTYKKRYTNQEKGDMPSIKEETEPQQVTEPQFLRKPTQIELILDTPRQELPTKIEVPVPQKKKARKLTEIETYQKRMTTELFTTFMRMTDFRFIEEDRVSRHRVYLKQQSVSTNRKTLIIDLDGTLICQQAEILANMPQPEVGTVTVNDKDGTMMTVSFYVRPYVERMLKLLHVFYEIIIFTAANLSYARPIINYLDPEKNCVDYVLHRGHCIQTSIGTVKDLRILDGRDMSQIIIVDNSVSSFASQIENGIYVPTYKGDVNDAELEKITSFLEEIADVGDVRPYVTKFAGIEKLYEQYKIKTKNVFVSKKK